MSVLLIEFHQKKPALSNITVHFSFFFRAIHKFYHPYLSNKSSLLSAMLTAINQQWRKPPWLLCTHDRSSQISAIWSLQSPLRTRMRCSPRHSCNPEWTCSRLSSGQPCSEGTVALMMVLYDCSQEVNACFVFGSGALPSKSSILVRVDLARASALSTMIRPKVLVLAVELLGSNPRAVTQKSVSSPRSADANGRTAMRRI